MNGFDKNNQNIVFSTEDVPKIVTDDLKNNIENLKGTKHKLFILSPMVGEGIPLLPLPYTGNGAFDLKILWVPLMLLDNFILPNHK